MRARFGRNTMNDKAILWIMVILATAGLAGSTALSQQPQSAQDYLLRTWQTLSSKLIDMAEDFPENKFDSRPHPDSRSFLEEIYHIDTVCRFFVARARGEQPDRSIIDNPEKKPKTRAELVAGLKEASGQMTELLKEREIVSFIPLMEGLGEHYGKLVTIYRMNGLVPPVTRARQ